MPLFPGRTLLGGAGGLVWIGLGSRVWLRRRSGAAERTLEIKIPAYPDGQFTVRSELTKGTSGNFSGVDLRHGITLKLPKGLTVDLIEVRRVAQ